MKKILIVDDGFPPRSWGGASTVGYVHAKGLQKEGFEVKVFTTTQDPIQQTGWSEFEGLPVRTFYTNYHYRWWAYISLNNKQITGKFEKELKTFAPDIVHFHNIHHYFSYKTIAIAKKNGVKIFLTAHDVMAFAYQKLHHFIDYNSTATPATFNYHTPWWVNFKDSRKRFNPLRNFVIRKYLRKVDQIFAVSNELKIALEQNGITGNISVVHNGIDAAAFNKEFDKQALRREMGLEGSKVVLFVGRFTPDKGRDVTLKALKEVVKTIPNAQLLVIGLDPIAQPEPALEKLIDNLGVRKNITFVPSAPYDEMYKYYALADCVVSPSIIFDTFILTNIEAMAAHKPTVTTCFGGAREVVIDEVTGFVINPLDVQLFAQKIILLLTDAAQADQMGEAGFERVKKEFSLEKQLAGYTKFY